MQEIILKLRSLISDVTQECKSDSIALSGGLDSSILASCLENKKVDAFVVLARDFGSTDLVYSQLVARLINLKLQVITATVDELLEAAEQTIKILKVFNPIEIRNNIVVYLVMKTAKEGGYTSMMTGDGADELFAGYNFFQRLSMKELSKDLERIWKIMHFPSTSIAKSIGISLDTPFLDKRISDYAKKIPPDLKVREENGKKYGKWLLRKAFENDLPESIVWREKAAMQDGSGTSGLTSFLNNHVPDTTFFEKSKNYLEKEKVDLSSKESLYYYEIYRKYYGVPHGLENSETRCPHCNYAITNDAHFCRMCGSYPI